MPSDLPWSLGGDEWNLLFLEHHSFALDRGWKYFLYATRKQSMQSKLIRFIICLVDQNKHFWEDWSGGVPFRLHCFDPFPMPSLCSLKLEGERNCSANGGHLASVTSQRTQDYLVAKNSTVWIGGHLIHGVIFNLCPKTVRGSFYQLSTSLLEHCSKCREQTFQEQMLITRVCGDMGPW